MTRPGVRLTAALASVLVLGPVGSSAEEAGPRQRAEPETALAAPGGTQAGDLRSENTAALMREWAEDVVYAYLNAWSAGNRTALTGLDDLYAAKVTFFGRRVDRAAIRDDKRRFVRRWPVRHYDHRPGSMNIACDVQAKLCRVRSIFDYRAENPARHARSEGAAELELGISFAGPRAEVVYENGRVLRIRSASNALP